MKRTGLYVFILLFLMTLGGCDKTEDGSYVKPITIAEKVTGTWKLAKFTQTDEIAKANGETNYDLVLTDQLSLSTFAITLNVTTDQVPGGYTISGTAPELLAQSGYWDLDYAYPHTDGGISKINLFSDAAKSTRTGSVDIMSFPGGTPMQMQFKLTRKDNGVAFISYTYLLTLQTQTK